MSNDPTGAVESAGRQGRPLLTRDPALVAPRIGQSARWPLTILDPAPIRENTARRFLELTEAPARTLSWLAKAPTMSLLVRTRGHG
jgi:hypothetical protein